MPSAKWLGVVLLLTLVGCQRDKVPEEQQPVKSTPVPNPLQPRDTDNSPSQPATPQSIVKELFPSAPAQAQNVGCFVSLTLEMSMYAVVQKCGRPDEDIGSGLYVFVYHLHDGSTVMISTPYLTRIDSVSYTDRSGKSSSLLRRK